MSVSLLIITHGSIGEALLATISHTFEKLPVHTQVQAIERQADPACITKCLIKQLSNLDEGDGVLILTDMYGSTPGNIAKQLAQCARTRVVAGINLPMLLRIMNYPNLDLDGLTEKALTGGTDGVLCYEQPLQ